jgi:hypothetical protein
MFAKTRLKGTFRVDLKLERNHIQERRNAEEGKSSG